MPLPVKETPSLSREQLQRLLDPFDFDRTKFPVVVVGIRGYYKDNMGAPGVNDRGIYDDAIFLVTGQITAAYNANTDPTSYRRGKGFGATKGMATLSPGAWPVYRFAVHRESYVALCQRSGPVLVTRDGSPDYTDLGYFGINIHRGGYKTTSSEGCQTIHPTQWSSFIELAKDQSKRYFGANWRSRTVMYVLLEA